MIEPRFGIREAKMHLPSMPERLPKAPGLENIASFAELRREGFMPFAMGPLYVYAHVHFSLIDAFLDDERLVRPQDTRGGRFIFGRPILARCEEWNYIVEAMDVPSYLVFKNWMPTNNFVDRPGRRFCVPKQFPSPVLDPLALDLKGLGIPEVLDVFTVSTNKVLLRPVCEQTYESVQPFIDFRKAAPEVEVLVAAEAVLGLI